MPLKKGNSKAVVSQNISEFHTGKTYAHTKSKFGKKKADAQAIAVAMSTARKYGKKAKGGKVPLPKKRPNTAPYYNTTDWEGARNIGDYSLRNNWRDFRRSDDIEDRRNSSPNVKSDQPFIGLDDLPPDTSALSDQLGSENLENAEMPSPNFQQRFAGQYEPRAHDPDMVHNLAGPLVTKSFQIREGMGLPPSAGFADGGDVEPDYDQEAIEGLKAQGFQPAQVGTPEVRATPTFGERLSNWWYGGPPPQPDAQGNLPEADMTNDPISRGIKQLGQAFTAPGRAMKGEIPESQMIPEAINMAGVVTGGTSLSPVEGGVGTGVGLLSKGKHINTYETFKQLENKGVHPEENFSTTGWYRGDDGLPRYWIDDSKAKLKMDKLSDWDGNVMLPDPDGSVRLGQIWDHPELYKAHPWLKDMPVSHTPPNDHSQGRYNPVTKEIHIAPQGPDEFHNALHHEVVHAIQHEEGFANGGDYTEFLPKGYNQNLSKYTEHLNSLPSLLEQKGINPGSIDYDKLPRVATLAPSKLSVDELMMRNDLNRVGMLNHVQNLYKIQRLLQKQSDDAFTRYFHLAGESEARDAPYLRENPQARLPWQVPKHFNPELKHSNLEVTKPFPRNMGTLGQDLDSEDWFPEEGTFKKGGSVKKHKQIDENPQDHEFIDFSRGGLIDSDIPGRTDKIPMKLRAGSYVLPADIPSALGQGNSKAGAEILKKMFTHGAYGLPPPHIHGKEFHYPHQISIGRHHKAAGGKSDEAKIVAAGGEFIVHPDVVRAVGHGDIGKGHKVLDKFVLHTRKQHIHTLKKLKPPK